MRIVGIDVGSTSVRAVEIESAFGRYEIQEYHEHKISSGLDPLTGPMSEVTTLMGALTKRPDKVVVSLRSGQVTFRSLHLPTRDKKAIQASVGFELDDDLPFALDQAIYDYSVLSQVGQVSHVHVAATLKRYVEGAIEQWKAAGIDPDIITTEAWAYRTLLNRALPPGEQRGPVLVAQLGHARSLLYVHHQGQPVVAREIQWGGRDLAAAISRKYGISIEQAETAKLDQGFVLTEAQRQQATQEQVDFSAAISEAMLPLQQEIRQAEFTCKNLTRSPLASIYLCGGTSLLPGIHRKIEEELQISTHPLKSLTSAAASGVTYSEQTDATFALATGLALTQVGPDRNLTVNLRKGALARQTRGREFNLTNLKGPLLAMTAILVCLFTSVFVQKQSYRKQLETIDGQLERGVRSFFTQLPAGTVKNYLANTATLKKAIDKELTKHREQAKLVGPNPHTPIAFLREISKAIPKDNVLDLMKIQIGAAPTAPYSSSETGAATLTFYTTDPGAADRLQKILEAKLPDLKRTEAQEVVLADGPKKYKITVTGKPTEDAYGK